ncbi:hypothetical protein [Rhizobium terrae]|nr:hypothetical protein [Rhizobium terrae]
MKSIAICALIVAILAAPCIYDISSTEPSPLEGLLAVAVSAR